MNEKEFNLEFDFEKEYGFDAPVQEPEAAINDDTQEFDLESIMAEDFGTDELQLDGEYDPDFDYGPEPEPEEESVPEIPAEYTEEEMELDHGYDEEISAEEEEYAPIEEDVEDGPLMSEKIREVAANVFDKVKTFSVVAFDKTKTAVQGIIAKLTAKDQPEPAAQTEVLPDGRVRKPMSPMRKFKNDTLPLIILGVSAVLILTFVTGAVSRGITNAKLNKEAAQIAAAEAEAQAKKETAEVQRLLEEAEVLAAGYNYEEAVAVLNTFSGSSTKYPEIEQAKSDYTMAQSQLVAYSDVSTIANLSFHVLVADPARAYADASFSSSYKNNFVTVSEFQNILEQLYNNNYILVDMDDFVTETTTDGVTSYEFTDLYLPAGKTPIMISETYGYHLFMVDSDGDGEADKNGGGFPTRLVLQGGEVKAEMVDASGNTVVGDYALVPILEQFIAAHPDFSFRGARATVAVTGYDGIFGYRTNAAVITEKGQEYYNEQVAGAQEIASALRDMGYTIACYSYGNKDYASISADQIQADMSSWRKEVTSVIGDVDMLIFAKGTDISTTGDYSGSKFTVLHNEGFRYFIGAGSSISTEVNQQYVRQVRLMVTGSQMANAASTYANFFDAASALDSARG